jgi:AcrR family transcriptional regulator
MRTSSQKSTAIKSSSQSAPVEAREPKRERGKQRVAALMDAGAVVIAERGYGAATMTEIAARAGASIGSLYQFFPSKEVLADALLKRYGERMAAALDAVVARAEGASAQAISEGLISVMTDLKADRAAALVLLDARDESKTARQKLRGLMLARIEQVLVLAAPRITAAKAQTMSVMLLYMMKAIPPLLAENGAKAAQLRDEARDAMQLYIGNGIG